jgi:hypothetical protein
LEHAFDGTSNSCAIVVEKHIDVARSGMGEVRTSAPKDGDPAADNNIPEPSLIQQSARFNEQRGRCLIERLEFVGHPYAFFSMPKISANPARAVRESVRRKFATRRHEASFPDRVIDFPEETVTGLF